jgi:hypothetical protein
VAARERRGTMNELIAWFEGLLDDFETVLDDGGPDPSG